MHTNRNNIDQLAPGDPPTESADDIVYIDGLPFTPAMLEVFQKDHSKHVKKVFSKEEILAMRVKKS